MGLWGLIKIALVVALVWFLYKGVKGWLVGDGDKRRVSRERAGEGEGQVLDIMVQDPKCGIYIPKREAVRARIRGEELYFCSKQCRDSYKEGLGSDSTDQESKPEQDKL